MYNTLKQIQEALSDEDLNKYANKAIGKNAEEIVEILKKDNIEVSLEAAKECVDYLKSIDIVSDEELENVTGGTCYSEGVADPETGTVRQYVIVTAGNPCPLNGITDWIASRTCGSCHSCFAIGPTMYCSRRWKGHNTPKVTKGLYGPDIESVSFVDD